jgi:hypothetical protein
VRPIALALIALSLANPAAQDRPLPDYETLAAQVKAHLATDEERQSGYMFIERRTEQKLDGSGRPKDESVKVFEVYPGLPGEDRYRRLIEEDGKRVPQGKLALQDRERQKQVESYARRASIGTIEGHGTILATLIPKNGVKPQTDDGKIMRHFKACAWISESDYELVRVEIEAIDDLSFGLGLLARVHKGTIATFQRRRVNNEIWLPERVTWTASARVLLLKGVRLRGVSEFSGYRKFTVDTSSTYTSPPP